MANTKDKIAVRSTGWSPARVFGAIADGTVAYDAGIPEEVAHQVDRIISLNAEAMSSVVFMDCAGASCPYASGCYLVRRSVAPVGRPCYYEVKLFERWVQSLVHDGNIDVTDTYTMMAVSGIVELMLLKRRCKLNMGLGGPGQRFRDLLVESEKMGPNNTVLTEYVAHPLLQEYLAIDQRIEKKVKELMATPLERDRRKQRNRESADDIDPSIIMSRMMAELMKGNKSGKFVEFSPVKTDMVAAEEEVVDAEFEE